MKKVLMYILFFLLTILISNQVEASDKGVVEGIIINKELDIPLSNASVYLKTDITKGTLSKSDGRFSLSIPAGEHTLIVTFTGMEKQRIPIKIIANDTIELRVEMDIYQTEFDEILISASRFEKTPEELLVTTDIVRPEFIKEKNITSIDNALDYVQGVVILDEDPQIRGGTGFTFGVGSKVNVMIDNMSIITGDAGKPDWNLVPIENLKQAEVVKGPGSVLSGVNAMSGAIFLYTEYPKEEPETRVQCYAGGYTSPDDNTMQWWDGWNYIAGVSFLHSQQLGTERKDGLVVSGNIEANRSYFGAPLDVESSLDTLKIDDDEMQTRKIRLSVNYKHQSKNIEGLNYGVNGTVLSNKSSLVMAWFDDSTNFYRGYPGTVFLREQTSFYIDPYVDLFTDEDTRHHFSLRLLYNDVNVINRPSQSTNASTIYGLYEYRRKYSEIKDLNIVAGIYGMKTFSNSDLYVASGSSKNQVTNTAIYLEMNKKFGSTINFNIGLRGDYYSISDTTTYITPILRTGINFKLFQETYLRLSYGQGYRFPTIAERYISTSFGSFGVFPNTELEPERGWNSEVGIKHGFKFLNFYAYLDVSAFLQQYQNTVEYLFGFWSPTFEPAVAGFKFVNTGKSRASGFELVLTTQSKIGNDSKMNLMAGYTYVVPESLEPYKVFAKDYNPSGNGEYSYYTTSVNPENSILKYRFQHIAKFNVSFEYKVFSIGLGGQLFSKVENVDKAIFDFEDATKTIGGDFPPILYRNFFYNNNKARLILDFNFACQLSKHNKINLIINNLLNSTYSIRPLKAEAMRSIILQYQLLY